MVNFAGGESMLELRVNGGNRYALALTAAGMIELRRYAGTTRTVLGSAASGVADLTDWASFSFVVQGAFPVTLTAYVNGVAKLSATDSTASAYTGSGSAGIAATISGILFDDFSLSALSAAPPPPPPPDGGPPDAGPPDAGPPDAGPPDAGPPDAGPPDAGPSGLTSLQHRRPPGNGGRRG